MNRTKQIAKEVTLLEQVFLRQAYNSIFKGIDIPPSQLVALVAIGEKKKCCLSDIGRQMNISSPTVTGIVDRLEKVGYVKRSPDKDDRRVTNIMATQKGEKLAKTFLNSIANKWEALLVNLPADDQENWLRIFRNIVEGHKDDEK